MGRPTISPRRPPALEPSRASQIDEAVDQHEPPTPHVRSTHRYSTELPFVVLRLPEVRPIVALAEPTRIVMPLKAKKERVTLIAVATALVLLAALLFSGNGKKQASNPQDNLNAAPAWQTSGTPVHQPLPAWKEPIVALPPIDQMAPITPNQFADGPYRMPPTNAQAYPETSSPARPPADRFPNYRTADRGASWSEQARPEAPALAPPDVRFDGTIEKNNPWK